MYSQPLPGPQSKLLNLCYSRSAKVDFKFQRSSLLIILYHSGSADPSVSKLHFCHLDLAHPRGEASGAAQADQEYRQQAVDQAA